MTQQNEKRLLSVKGSIMLLLTANSRKWFSSRAITVHLKVELGRDIKPTSSLLQLVKSGHIERAYKPRHLINSKNGKQEFIYRWSGKAYHDKIESLKKLLYEDMPPTDRAIIMSFLKAHYPNLPGWYRRMIL
ncbi:MAG: hypothetical protein A3B66_08545 [Alphaproteobacteria bacterium RIFCSPHIGHO2_02_FULL_46_13]|nr:MAG: hypothetical protein A3B66_08545 [Alphaproteobacteria bacterium RIFCSPHIGHO2_02_FULL_46_13]